ncbi:NAD(P)-binding protein [Cryphonectria parasitica EP155]|uniref:NAD(P)-binding protein n=1 Tax=Cryphonectria parasitica (strain ATCC 38755 / EP155) TaxID=660469 RepID=A0A9P5CLI7_CRYP1|nr:NAD(P)-binding protein [Cryphonectria parasitica EP155]KAF3763384.1 NAD(P)-binding protein [Cryphonectria parasitica EP155]
MSTPVWLITGASAGFGLILSLRALKAGHRVIGSVRSRTRSSDAVKSIEGAGGVIIEMDMTEPQASIVKKVQDAEAIYGRIDVLINNAGYSLLGPIAQMTENEVRRQFETNVFGSLHTIQGVLPGMRSRKTGTIVNISSSAGQDALVTGGIYSASKFALEAISESLAREEVEFGISVLIVEPGPFRTNFLGAFVANEKGIGQDTPSGLLSKAMAGWKAADGKQPGDPEKGSEVIFQVVSGEGEAGALKGKILRLPLGKSCVARIEEKLKSVRSDVEASREVAYSADF